uniref:Uncharacterized protein n=1 Tax=Grammatophora oceanica TaxID=210454 RepID=A0A7S1V7A6_9STRA|mmetsp:Transcript_38634/g.57439  ORF Transcript_38634/g.57439 Transcript_38634/m.57439 type:complete len:303 (+) Transcript_38634:46-954(+)
MQSNDHHPSSRRVIVAVSGTIQDGFELRPNIDYRAADGDGDEEDVVEALFLGFGVFRGVKMYFDVKNPECREYSLETAPHRVNPAMILTGDALDMNQYALYLVDERACMNALLGEPRYLTMTPDAIRLCLNDCDTSPNVRAIARAMIDMEEERTTTIASSNNNQTMNHEEACVLSVVSCYHDTRHFHPAPFVTRSDGSRLTSFRSSLATFAGVPTDDSSNSIQPGSKEWNDCVAKALQEFRRKQEEQHQAPSTTAVTNIHNATTNNLYGSDKFTCRLSRRMTVEEFNHICETAGVDLQAPNP